MTTRYYFTAGPGSSGIHIPAGILAPPAQAIDLSPSGTTSALRNRQVRVYLDKEESQMTQEKHAQHG
jgi:hypothetical protein